jgi:hypothetical protein
VIVEPPLLAGGRNLTVALALAELAMPISGAPGSPVTGVTVVLKVRFVLAINPDVHAAVGQAETSHV